MGAFLTFLDTPADRQSSAVAAAAEDYDPARDFYRQIREAIKSGRRMRNDQRAMNSVLLSCTGRKKPHYREIAAGWLQFVESCRGDVIVDFDSGWWRARNLAVRVTPELAVRREDGSHTLIKLFLRAQAPTARDISAALWLMGQAIPPGLAGSKVMLLDVRRCAPHTEMPIRTGIPRWLNAEAARYAELHGRTAA